MILCIGTYEKLTDRKGAIRDYSNLFDTFYRGYGYSVCVKLSNDNKTAFYDFFSPNNDSNIKSNNSNNRSNEVNTSKIPFKIEWTTNEIGEFIEDSKKRIKEKNHDALVFLISSHAANIHENTVVFDSKCQELRLDDILSSFNGKNVKSLAKFPKIFIIDTPRGKETSNEVEYTMGSAKNLKSSNNCQAKYSFHKRANFVCVFSSNEGFRSTAGRLIEAINKTFDKAEIRKNMNVNLNDIMFEIRENVSDISEKAGMAGVGMKEIRDIVGTQLVEDVNDTHYNIYFSRNSSDVKDSLDLEPKMEKITLFDEYRIKNALVAILPILEYGDEMPSLNEVEMHYKEILHTFYARYRYSLLIAQTEKNGNRSMDSDDSNAAVNICALHLNQTIKQSKNDSLQLKTYWKTIEIEKYIELVANTVADNNYDSLIFMLTSHMIDKKSVLDSQCDSFPLQKVIAKYFVNQFFPFFFYTFSVFLCFCVCVCLCFY